jgi:hypothetical protein
VFAIKRRPSAHDALKNNVSATVTFAALCWYRYALNKKAHRVTTGIKR